LQQQHTHFSPLYNGEDGNDVWRIMSFFFFFMYMYVSLECGYVGIS
jgi:hypothetical protein